MENLGEKQIEKLIAGLQRALGRDVSEEKIGEILSAKDFGHVYAVCETWNRLGLTGIRAHVFLCVLTLQIERLMRNRLRSVSVRKAIDRLRQIKAGELRLNGVTTKSLARATEEQQNLLKFLDVPLPRIAKAEAL